MPVVVAVPISALPAERRVSVVSSRRDTAATTPSHRSRERPVSRHIVAPVTRRRAKTVNQRGARRTLPGKDTSLGRSRSYTPQMISRLRVQRRHAPVSRHRMHTSAAKLRSHQTIYRHRGRRTSSSRPQLTSHLQRPSPWHSRRYSKRQWSLGIETRLHQCLVDG